MRQLTDPRTASVLKPFLGPSCPLNPSLVGMGYLEPKGRAGAGNDFKTQAKF